MIVVALQGGLGNQMFQYAAGLRLAVNRNAKLKIHRDLVSQRTEGGGVTPRPFGLDAFGIPEKSATEAEIRRFRRLADPGSRSLLERVCDKMFRRTYFPEQGLGLDIRVLDLPDNTYLDGYFQHAEYFADVEGLLRQRFQGSRLAGQLTDEMAAIERAIEQRPRAVCMHVRRGDYVTDPKTNAFHGVCSGDYYSRALAQARANGADGRVFVFSDDPAWCRETLSRLDGLTIVDAGLAGSHPAISLRLMTRCSHFILSNSSFGWWAAWLCDRPGKIVIRPASWFQARKVDICPPEWIALPND